MGRYKKKHGLPVVVLTVGRPNLGLGFENSVDDPEACTRNHGRVGQQRQVTHRLVSRYLAQGGNGSTKDDNRKDGSYGERRGRKIRLNVRAHFLHDTQHYFTCTYQVVHRARPIPEPHQRRMPWLRSLSLTQEFYFAPVFDLFCTMALLYIVALLL
jgi:hypothetical protein